MGIRALLGAAMSVVVTERAGSNSGLAVLERLTMTIKTSVERSYSLELLSGRLISSEGM